MALADNPRVNVTIYRFTGQHGPLQVAAHECEECDLSIALVNRLVQAIHPDCFEVEVKSWFLYFWEPLLKGGWHPPIIMIDGQIFSQGIVPDPEGLRSALIQAVERKLAACAPDLSVA